jgi:6-phosphogluconate dehydrogenase
MSRDNMMRKHAMDILEEICCKYLGKIGSGKYALKIQ